MDKQLKSELVHLLVTYCSAINNLEEYLARLIEKESVELFSFNKEYIKTIWKVSDYKCSTCDLGKWSHTSEGPSDARQQRAVCKLCQSLYDRITDKHALKSPNWANVEWQLIMIEPLQHMKCYIKEYGHREVRMVRQLGLSALIQICLNHCDLKTLFGNALPFLEQISEKQDQVFQSETLHIGEDDLNTHLRKIEDVLKIVCGGTDMDITSHTMSAKIFNAGQQQFTVEDELKTKLKIIQTLDRRIHSLKCWQTLCGNSQDDQELQKLLFIKNLHCQKLQERNQQLASNTHGKIQRYEKQKQVLKNYTDEINKISTDNSSHYCESGMMSDLTVQSPHDKYNQTLLEETHDNVIEALENTHTNKNGIETAICLLRDIHDKFDACSAGIFLVPGTSKEEGFRSVAQTDSKSYLDSRKIIRNINRPMETDTPGEVSTTTKARLIQSPSGLNTQEPVNGQKRSLKRPYQCLESECPKVTVTPNLQAIRTESPNSFNSTETVPEHISLLERPLQYLEEGGNTICRINHECMAFYLSCPNVLNVINLCEDVLNGKVEALFLPLQNYLRTQPDCNNVSVVVDISGNDFTKCIMPCLIKLNRQLDSRIQQLENPYKQNNKASTAAGNTDMKTAISMFKDLIDHHPSVNCETPSELRLTVDTLGVEDSHTLTRHLVDAANELQRHKKNAKYRETLQRTDQHKKNGIETAISIFKGLKGQIPFIDETSELRLNVEVIGVMDGHSLTRQIFDAAIELHSTEETKTSHSQELRQYLQHVFQYLKKGGNALNIRETDCSAFYICCPTLANAMTLCEDFITGKVEALFQPLQGYLKTLPECQDVSIVVDISESDFVNCILPSLTAIKRQLDSWVPAQGPDSRGSVAVSKYADKGIESCTSNKQDSSFDGQFSVHPWDRLISHLCEEFSVEDSDFENFLLGSKTRIGDDNYNRIQSLDGRSGQKYHALFDCLERKFGQHDSVEFLLHLTATLNFHSDSACVTYTTAFEQYKQDIEELHLTTKGLVMEPSCKIVDILQKRPEENVSSYERHPKGVVLWGQLGMGMTRFLNQILWRLRFGSLTTSIVRQWNIVAVNQRDKTEVKELSSNMINNIRKEMGMEDIICDFISVNDQKQNLMSLLKDLGKRKGDYLVILDDMDGHFKHEHSPCEQFLTDVMDTIAEVDNIKIILTVSKSVSKSNVIDSFGGKLVFAGHMLEFNLTEEILTENIPTEEILMPKISCLEDQNLSNWKKQRRKSAHLPLGDPDILDEQPEEDNRRHKTFRQIMLEKENPCRRKSMNVCPIEDEPAITIERTTSTIASPKSKPAVFFVPQLCKRMAPKQPTERQCMRDWLMEKLESQEFRGLRWRDRKEKIFSIKWFHGSRHGYSEKESAVFEAWAVHTGRRDGSDARRWKANFRCALKSLKTIQELDRSVNTGQNACRIFRFLDNPANRRRANNQTSRSTDSGHSSRPIDKSPTNSHADSGIFAGSDETDDVSTFCGDGDNVTVLDGNQRLLSKINDGERRLASKIHDGENRFETTTRDGIERLKQAAIEQGQDDYEIDLLRRLGDHYRDNVSYMPLSTLDASRDKFSCIRSKMIDPEGTQPIVGGGGDGIEPTAIEVARGLQKIEDSIKDEKIKKDLQDIISKISHGSVHKRSYIILTENLKSFVTNLGSSVHFSLSQTKQIIKTIIVLWNKPFIARHVMKEVYNEDIGDETEVPKDVKNMHEKAIEIYSKLIKDGTEKIRNIRLMVLGMFGVGKTSLVNNLIKDFRDKNIIPPSTEGIDLHKCQLMENGDWCLDNEHKLTKYQSRFNKGFKEIAISPLLKTNVQDDSDIKPVQNAHVASNIPVNQRDTRSLETIAKKVKEKLEEDIVKNVLPYVEKQNENIREQDVKQISSETRTNTTVSVWDFTGPTLYFSTHQFFLNKRSVYLVLMDMTKSLDDHVREDESLGIWCGLIKECTFLEVFKFWLNAIHMYSDYRSSVENLKPSIILVGTRKDEMVGSNDEKEIKNDKYFEKALRRAFEEDSPILKHIHPKKFLVNNLSPADPVFNQLRTEILSLAESQEYWGEKSPLEWIPLKQSLDDLREECLRLLKIEDVEKANK